MKLEVLKKVLLIDSSVRLPIGYRGACNIFKKIKIGDEFNISDASLNAFFKLNKSYNIIPEEVYKNTEFELVGSGNSNYNYWYQVRTKDPIKGKRKRYKIWNYQIFGILTYIPEDINFLGYCTHVKYDDLIKVEDSNQLAPLAKGIIYIDCIDKEVNADDYRKAIDEINHDIINEAEKYTKKYNKEFYEIVYNSFIDGIETFKKKYQISNI